jgi:hypothetical protein
LDGNDLYWSVLQESPAGPGGVIRGPAKLEFKVFIGFEVPGGPQTLAVTNSLDLPGTEPLTDSFPIEVVVLEDSDGDDLADKYDNCVLVPNPWQCDYDDDHHGNDCDGDFDQSGLTDEADLDRLREGFFATPLPWELDVLDMNCDGAVNMLDLGLFKAGYGQPPGPSGWHTDP